ncbi:MAG: putative metal-binding motif-containing protein, partial [Alphaproteobacteria bacterium]|nr:putative metal-binding motif-containing protein [Alphaproteobacteria bacterium]
MPRVLLLIVAMACAPAPRGSDVRVPDVAPELCNGVDDDGDGLVDEADPDLVGAFEVAWPVDADGDGFPGGQRVERTCDPTPPPPAPPSDCNDADPHTFPGAARHESATSCMRDADGDGWGDPQRPLGGRGGRDCDDGDPFAYPGAAAREAQGSCTRDADRDGYGALIPPPGGRAGTDCDDTDPLIRPGALDLPYDGVDADCAGDDDLDRDGDGHRALVVPGGDDCDDRNPSVHPGAVDVALDGVDQDCDGHDNCDGDGDGFEALACGGTDCADGDPFRHPLAVERCDGVDQDCDGVADDGLPARVVWRDRDRDGFGDPTTSDSRCLDEAGSWVAQAGDCDDSDRLRRPGAPERCNDLDDDCDGLVDVGAVEGRDWFPDDDGDGYGRTEDRVHVCIGPPGHVPVGGDCADAFPGIHPDQVDRSCGDVNCNGRALRVPDDVPDIATALARRAPGDTVCLGVGTF